MSVCILFGAGADSMYGIGAGGSFTKPLLKSKYSEERRKLLGSTGSSQLVYPSSTKVYLQTIAEHRKEAEDIWGKDLVEKLCAYYDDRIGKYEEVKPHTQRWYGLLTKKEEELTDAEKTECNFFIEKAVFFDSLDEKFNSLRNVPLNSKARRVVNAYTTIFILMLESLYHIPEDFPWSFNSVFDLLKTEYSKENRVQVIKESKETYYTVVKDTDFKIATTNYTSIAEKVTEKDVVYLHGKMHWFEDYKHLRVLDCLDENERKELERNQDSIFPFLLIPSGVKPLICKKEIDQFSRFIAQLTGSDVLCVMGYKFNSEDNHINSIISEWLTGEGKKLVYFNYNTEVDWAKFAWAEPFTKKTITAGDAKKVLEYKENIVSINVNGDTSLPTFKKVIAELQKMKG